MSLRDWLPNATAGGIAVVGVLFGIAGFAIGLGLYASSPAPELVAAYKARLAEEYRQEQRQDAETADYSDGAKDRRDAVFWRGADGSSETYESICAKPKHHDDADLCQQWRTAEFARKQVGIGIATLAGLSVTVWLAGWNLFVSRRGTRAAVDAAKAATDEAKTSREALAQQRTAYEEMERPYCFVSRLEIDWNHFSQPEREILGGHVWIGISNHGRTPAILREVEVILTRVLHFPPHGAQPPERHLFKLFHPIPAGGAIDTLRWKPASIAVGQKMDIEIGTTGLRCHVRASYMNAQTTSTWHDRWNFAYSDMDGIFIAEADVPSLRRPPASDAT